MEVIILIHTEINYNGCVCLFVNGVYFRDTKGL